MIKNLIEKLNSVLKFSKENFKSSNIKGTDTAVEYAENAEGIDVMVASANGSETAPNGVIELDNGDSFEVVDGKIAKVISTEKADEAKEDEKTEELADEKKEDEKVEIIIADAKEVEAKAPETKEDEKAKALEDEIEKLKSELKELKGEFSKLPTNEDLKNFQKDFLKELKNTPAEKFNTVVVEEKTENDKWEALAKRYA